MDIGANPINGVSPYKNLIDAGACEVWGVEPQKAALAKLLDTATPHERYLPDAIGSGDKGLLRVCESDGFTSFLPPSQTTIGYLNYFHSHMRVVETIEMETSKLDDVTGIPGIDLLKIDVQGSEVDVFEGGAASLRDAVAIISEVSFIRLYENQPLFHDQASVLERLGFQFTKFLFLKARHLRSRHSGRLDPKKNKNQLIDGDAVFIRNFLEDKNYSDEQLKHLAICADSVFESYDLSLRCINTLVDRGRVGAEKVENYVDLLPTLK
ncbi:FkbM family methyltransferase [Roseicyclus marinus]|uniref:FkbM family methyltransferase n=1 Tax=Roseicyclus marinus TaxID=2161673 RepID=UPI00240EC2B5|nr:FkbM family methyltransferase [Roseicyclus marinus]MDG3041971.1 FkbM family methyltransferase [Roseicyclus marinus]